MYIPPILPSILHQEAPYNDELLQDGSAIQSFLFEVVFVADLCTYIQGALLEHQAIDECNLPTLGNGLSGSAKVVCVKQSRLAPTGEA